MIVEGPKDARIIEAFVERFNKHNPVAPPHVTLPSMGLHGIARVASVLASRTEGRIVIIIDGDRDAKRARELITDQLSDVVAELFVLDPGIEKWLGVKSVSEFRRYNTRGIGRLVERVDMLTLATADADFRRFATLFGVHFTADNSQV